MFITIRTISYATLKQLCDVLENSLIPVVSDANIRVYPKLEYHAAASERAEEVSLLDEMISSSVSD
mgnify:CR=1 FL=1